jgi:hypothetical protein
MTAGKKFSVLKPDLPPVWPGNYRFLSFSHFRFLSLSRSGASSKAPEIGRRTRLNPRLFRINPAFAAAVFFPRRLAPVLLLLN